MGKTAVFVLSVLHRLEQECDPISALILCHTRELAYQIEKEFKRFNKYLNFKTAVIYGGQPIADHERMLNKDPPQIIVGTPGRILTLARRKSLDLKKIKYFILDECDKMLQQLDMRADVQQIFKLTPHEKQVMMFSATLATEIRPVCRKFMKKVFEIFIDNESKLTLHGLQQYYVKLSEKEKNRNLSDLLDALIFNQVIIFVRNVIRATELDQLLRDCGFPSICIHGHLEQSERYSLSDSQYQALPSFQGFQTPYHGSHWCIRPWNWYRASQYCHQLRYAR